MNEFSRERVYYFLCILPYFCVGDIIYCFLLLEFLQFFLFHVWSYECFNQIFFQLWFIKPSFWIVNFEASVSKNDITGIRSTAIKTSNSTSSLWWWNCTQINVLTLHFIYVIHHWLKCAPALAFVLVFFWSMLQFYFTVISPRRQKWFNIGRN